MIKIHYLLIPSYKLFKINVEEILREKTTNYNLRSKRIDFWLIKRPKLIHKNEITKQIEKARIKEDNDTNKIYVLISFDKAFISWFALKVTAPK